MFWKSASLGPALNQRRLLAGTILSMQRIDVPLLGEGLREIYEARMKSQRGQNSEIEWVIEDGWPCRINIS